MPKNARKLSEVGAYSGHGLFSMGRPILRRTVNPFGRNRKKPKKKCSSRPFKTFDHLGSDGIYWFQMTQQCIEPHDSEFYLEI